MEALSSHLCLPSPAIVNGGWVGRPVGRSGAVVDKFGDAVMNCHDIFGDTWRRRHDTIKQHIVSEAMLAGVHTDCEVYGLFSELLPHVLQEEGGELQWARARQGLVPDFKFLMTTPQGPQSFLSELKCISAGKSWFPRGVEGVKGTDRHANLLVNEYEAKLRKYDRRFHNRAPVSQSQSQPLPPGPLVQKFRSFDFLKLVAGPWGDLSQDFHQLLKTFAEKRVENLARGKGVVSGEGELGKVMGEVRRAMSVQVVRSNALCLLERLAFLSPGARAAGERRQVVQRLEERRRRQVQAYNLAHNSRGLSRVGRAFVP